MSSEPTAVSKMDAGGTNMDALTPTKDEIQVRLISFIAGEKSENQQNHCLTPPVLITVNGRSSPRHEIPPSPKSEKVKLIGFAYTDYHRDTNGSATMNGNFKKSSEGCFKDSQFEKERKERLAQLMKETQEWFSCMREGNHKWRRGVPSGNASEKMKQFFEDARKKFSAGNSDLFAEFVRENQESFVQLLQENNMTSVFSNFPQRPTSVCFDNTTVLTEKERLTRANEKREAFGQARSFSAGMSVYDRFRTRNESNGMTDSCYLNGTSSQQCSPQIETETITGDPQSTFTHGFTKSVSSSSFSTTCYSETGSSNHNRESKSEFRNSQCTSFPNFPTSSPTKINLSSPTKIRFRGSRSGAYHMTSSRSTFEYCGDTNTYRFSTEHVIQRYEQGYESISESEDEEESLEDATNTVGEPSEFDNSSVQDVDIHNDSGCLMALEHENKKGKIDRIPQILHKIALEILTTERTYVSILYLLDQVFAFRVDQENRAHPMFPQEVVTQMFSNLKSIYKLHHDFLLPQLKERLEKWETERRIGDIMKNFAPFLKMYTEYVKNYDNSMKLIHLWYSKQPRFSLIMDDIHRMEECGNLTLQHHLLTPVQRVPRYQLLLKDYLKKLPENSPDKADTEKALELVSTAAIHANEAMKKIDKFKKLLEVQEMTGGVVDLVSPTRELVKEAKIIKISARSGDHQERHLFLELERLTSSNVVGLRYLMLYLNNFKRGIWTTRKVKFNDLLLLCSQRLISNRVVSGPCFRVRARLSVEGLVIEEGDNLETANTFYIRSTGRSIELYTQTPEDKMEWMEALAKSVHDLIQRKSSLRIGENLSPDVMELGSQAPIFIKQDSVSHCMVCGSQFSTFSLKRKHHCRACGIVACNKCLTQKSPLPYDNNKTGRVCGQCYDTLSQSLQEKVEQTGGSQKENIESPVERKGILEVKPSDSSVISSYLQLKSRSRMWVWRWFSLHEDFVLYSFRSHEEEKAVTSMPVPGYTVALPEKSDNVDGRENVFKLFHKKKVYYFQAADPKEQERWVSALEKASRAEFMS